MKTKIKYSLIGLIIGIILTTATPVLADSIIQKIDVIFNSVQVQVNGEKLDTNSILYNGSTYLPMRTVAEAVGKKIDWNQETMTANIIEKKETIVDSTLPTIIDYGFKNNGDSTTYTVTFSDLFTVGLASPKLEVPGLPSYESILINAYVENMDKNFVISEPKIVGFNESFDYKYYPISYEVYGPLFPKDMMEFLKGMDFYKKFNLRANGENFGGALYFESFPNLDGVNYDDGVHKCTLYLKEKEIN